MAYDMRRLLDEAKNYLAKPKKANTLERYQRIWTSLNQSGLSVVEYVSYVGSITPGQFVLTRAAAIHGLWRVIRQKIYSAVRNMAAGHITASTDDQNVAADARVAIEMLRHQKPPKEAFTRKGRSKRGSIGKLPEDWQKRLADNTITAALPAVLVSLLSGCRPEELSMGITVSVIDDRHLSIFIEGAKATDTNGQPWRKLTCDIELSPLAAQLWRITARKGGVLKVKREVRTLHANMAAASKRAGLPPICAYIARHYLASQLKHVWSGDKVRIAMALGHASTATQKRYGSRQQGRKGAVAIVEVEAARPVRTPDRPHPGLSRTDKPSEGHGVGTFPWVDMEPSPFD
jgi:integrase